MLSLWDLNSQFVVSAAKALDMSLIHDRIVCGIIFYNPFTYFGLVGQIGALSIHGNIKVTVCSGFHQRIHAQQ